jgi:hypothetical protein
MWIRPSKFWNRSTLRAIEHIGSQHENLIAIWETMCSLFISFILIKHFIYMASPRYEAEMVTIVPRR